MTKDDVYAGAVRAKSEDLTLPYIWVSLHISADVHAKSAQNERFAAEMAGLTRSDMFLLEALETVDADRWSGLCSSVGWTSHGAVALSWCRGGTLRDVGRGLASAQARFVLTPAFQRLATLLCPAVLPDPLTLASLTRACDNEYQGFCLALADPALEVGWDMSPETLAQAPDAARPFLQARLDDAPLAEGDRQMLRAAWQVPALPMPVGQVA
ncbi:MAG: hypothetical protein MUD11_08230 [Rhodobacteraceae bacterium]|jgi:hypothetical protein|nr:hypothetical protein [Paracoccaceae bacterium]